MLKVLSVKYYKIKADTTFDKYEGIYQKLILDRDIGNLPINDISSDVITKFFSELTSGKYQKGTPMILKSLLRATLKMALKDKWINDTLQQLEKKIQERRLR